MILRMIKQIGLIIFCCGVIAFSSGFGFASSAIAAGNELSLIAQAEESPAETPEEVAEDKSNYSQFPEVDEDEAGVPLEEQEQKNPENVPDEVETAAEDVQEKAQDVQEKAQEAQDTVEDKVEEDVEATKEAAEKAASETKEGAEGIIEKVKGLFSGE